MKGQNEQDKHRKRAERNGSTKRKRMSQLATDDDNMLPYIDDAVRKAKKKLHRTQNADDPTKHRAHVCIVCDCFIMETEPLRTMNRAQLKAHKHRLGVTEYEQYHQVRLIPLLIKQYHVPSLPHMLLSRRSRKVGKGFIACGHCRLALRALVAPTRPYGCIFAYSDGSHKSIQGHLQFFETHQSHVGGVIDHE